MFPLYSLTENVRLFFYCNNPECCDSLCTIGGREQLRRRPPPAAETGSRSRGRGRRGDGPPKGRRTMRAPQPVGPRRLAYRRAKTVQWTILERKSLHSLIGRKGGCTIPFGAGSCVVQALAFASRGPVAKNAPQERFLNAPAACTKPRKSERTSF